jgi:Ca2+-binding RTX toxin-like protein
MRKRWMAPVLAGVLGAAVLGAPPAAGDVYGTTGDDTIVYGKMYYYAIPDGGGWAPRYWGEGGCVFAYDAGDYPTYRGAFVSCDADDYGGPWNVVGDLGADYIYHPSRHDGGSLVCDYVGGGLPNHKVETDSVEQLEMLIKGDTTSYTAGSADRIWSCPSWSCTVWAGGGGDYVMGGTAGDEIWGDAGNDELRGGDGADYLYGYTGDDTLYGDSGQDHLVGGTGDDILVGGADYDWCNGEGHVYGDYCNAAYLSCNAPSNCED